MAMILAEKLFRRPKRFQVQTDSRSLTLHSKAVPPNSPLLSVSTAQLDKLPEEITQQTRGGIIEIVVPAEAILQRRLESLPFESLPYLEKVVQHQIETIFPWRSTDILYSTVIERRADGKLDVSARATARSAIAPALAMATACGADEILIVADTGNEEGDRSAAIVASDRHNKESKWNRARLIARYAILALILFATCVVGWTSLASFTLSNEVAALDQAIADRRGILKRQRDSIEVTHNHDLKARKSLAPVIVDVIDKLSSVLPDNTYLTDLSLESGHLRISGVSADVASLVPLLEGSGYFKNALFYAPTTRMAGGTTDRFNIEAVVVSQPR